MIKKFSSNKRLAPKQQTPIPQITLQIKNSEASR